MGALDAGMLMGADDWRIGDSGDGDRLLSGVEVSLGLFCCALRVILTVGECPIAT